MNVMHDKRRDGRYIPEGNSVLREIQAIKENENDSRLKFEHDVEVHYDKNLLKVLKNILLKVTKAS